MPAPVQYAWRHPAKNLLYVASGKPSDPAVPCHITVFEIGRNGDLSKRGAELRIPSRPINITVDHTGGFLLIAYGGPRCRNSVSVHAIADDGSLGPEIEQPSDLDVGIFPHQIRMSPSNDRVIMCARGNSVARDGHEDPGAIKVYSFDKGRLANHQSVTINGGINFRPRHLDFHPNGRWVYVIDEEPNRLLCYDLDNSNLGESPRFIATTLADPENVKRPQMASAIHMHPQGTHVYVSNRAWAKKPLNGNEVFAGGENNIVVYEIDPRSGEHRIIQHAPIEGFHPRTFSIDPSTRLVTAIGMMEMEVEDNGAIKHIPRRLTVFELQADGKLRLIKVHDLDVQNGDPFWTGFFALPA